MARPPLLKAFETRDGMLSAQRLEDAPKVMKDADGSKATREMRGRMEPRPAVSIETVPVATTLVPCRVSVAV